MCLGLPIILLLDQHILSIVTGFGTPGPPKCKFFLWLVALQRCWTADRLQRRGLDHPDQCPLCDQEMETIDHLLVSCVFATNYWFKLLTKVSLQNFTPYVYEENTMLWWKRCSDQLHGIARKGLVGSMLRRRRSYREKRSSDEAVCIR
jgi:hypothetical protein